MSSESAAEPYASTSLWRRLRHTPLRDVFRGRILGRLDVERIIAMDDLPFSLADLVRATVRRTRLWRLEKVDVASELVAHFQDGLATGATTDDLAVRFGDARSVAKLIRRAKLRRRPLPWRSFVFACRGVTYFLGLLLAIYILLAIRIGFGSPSIDRNYVAEINAPVLAVAESQRAWPLYRQALLQGDEWPLAAHVLPTDLRPGTEECTTLVTYVQDNADAIAPLCRRDTDCLARCRVDAARGRESAVDGGCR